MSEKTARVVVSHNGEIVGEYDSLSGYSLESGDKVEVFEEGVVMASMVNDGGRLEISGGVAAGTNVYTGGVVDCQAGWLDDTTLFYKSCLDLSGAARRTVVIGADMTLREGAVASDVTITGEGNLQMNQDSFLEDCKLYAGTLGVDGGNIWDVEVASGTMTVENDGIASGVYLSSHAAALVVRTGSFVENLVVDGAVVEVGEGASVLNAELWDYIAISPETGTEETYSTTMTLQRGAACCGALFIDSKSTLVVEEGAAIDFTLAASEGGEPLLNDFSRISGAPDFTMTVSGEQTAGSYALAQKASGFDAPVSLHCDNFASMDLAVGGNSVVYHNSVYALDLKGGTLSATVTDFTTSGSADALSWGDINDAEGYQLQLASETGMLSLNVATRGVDLLGLANGDYAWRVRNTAEADNWQTGEAFSQTEETKEPQQLEAASNGTMDLFLARCDGIWGSDYCAENVFTGERRSMKGMGRVTDVFAGSEDASILVLCGGNVAENGVALFLDDIYSASPEPGTQASGRLSRINTILATEKADLIDLTSARFDCDGGMNVHGGAGNDILWGGGKGCRLFGDEGDDSLSGTAGDDLLVGGSGNDVIQCLGGEDVLCFGPDWGADLVLQQTGGKLTLWFAEGDPLKWDEKEFSYSDGTNSVRVAGGVAAADITLKFGDDGSEMFNQLRDFGFFLA